MCERVCVHMRVCGLLFLWDDNKPTGRGGEPKLILLVWLRTVVFIKSIVIIGKDRLLLLQFLGYLYIFVNITGKTLETAY